MNRQGSSTNTESGSEREIVLVREFDAPRDLVFTVWTDPQHVVQWWGPRGFSTTTRSMDVRPGGVWRFTMHGPDGRDYENRITFLDVTPPERLVYKHGGEEDLEPVNFQVTVTFEDLGGRTRLTMKSLFPSAAARDFVIKTYGADEGGRQHLERLGEYLATMSDSALQPTGTYAEFAISRVFPAPRETVWKLWTQRDHLMHWFGPKGCTIPTCTLDFRPGGVFHYRMRFPGASEMWGRWVFREIIAPQRLVFVSSFADDAGNVTRPPFDENWPREMLSTVNFDDHAGIGRGTVVTVRTAAINASDDERRTFEAGFDSMRHGWGGTFDRLADYLAKV